MSSNKKDSQVRVLVKVGNDIHKIGDVIIKRLTGEIYYSPSSKEYLDASAVKKEIIHFSWHKSGDVVLKLKTEAVQHKGVRTGLEIRQIGFQDLFRDLILEPIKLPIFIKQKRVNDILFDLKDYKDQILLSFSVISGKLIIKRYRGEETPLNFVNVAGFRTVVGLEKRALGFESRNSDKLLQIILLKTSGDATKLKTKRRILILPDQKISNN